LWITLVLTVCLREHGAKKRAENSMTTNRGGRVAGKVAIVTGGASGIGAASALRLAREGAKVLVTDLNIDGGERVADEIRAAGGDAGFVSHDVTDEAQWLAVAEDAKRRYGTAHILVNNAGIAGSGPLLEQTLEAWRRVMAVNLDGAFLGMRHIGPLMAASGGGSIINVSSILGKVGSAGSAAYCASKGGILQLTKAAALEWAPLGIRVNSVHPGYIETPLVNNALQLAEDGKEMRELLVTRHAMGRLGVPREIADGIVFLASDESSFMTGSELVIDGGYTAA
jgi:NAD(P)-dependent dehydrogenase (short-subunit alcohol dehydrogenase family)